MYKIAAVAIENTAYHFDKAYSYLIPEPLPVQPGCRVRVPFGRGNRVCTGVVLAVEEAPDRGRLKPVAELIDEKPLLSAEMLGLVHYLRETTFCTYFDAVRLLIPSGVAVALHNLYRLGEPPPRQWSPAQTAALAYLAAKTAGITQETFLAAAGLAVDSPELIELLETGAVVREQLLKQKIQDEKVCMVRLTQKEDDPPSFTKKQQAVLDFLEENETASLKEICYYTGVTRVVPDKLQKLGAVEYYWRETFRNPYEAAAATEQAVLLSPSQQAAYEELSALCQKGDAVTALLYGVTGSGKTQVFLHLCEHVLAQGRTVVIMVPEISLTAQVIDSFHRRFGARVAVLHSGLSLGERMDEWKRLQQGEAQIAVGTRSAVFAPLDKIGLMVIDEEQEHTYKSDRSPRFHARDVALVRCRHHKAMLLLSSATPSVESYYKARKGDYHLVTLEGRFHQERLPDVYIVDMGDSQNLTGSPSISGVLAEELQYNLQRGEQSILLLNRRGYSTVIKCSSCGKAAECPNCSVSLTYHTANQKLLCHYCGYSQPREAACSHCGSELVRFSGVGTQRLEEEVAALCPNARILRIDVDTTMQRFSHEKLFGAFAAGEYDIMIGTQMVAKGLNFPRVTLVGVVSADQSLFSGDFRSFERSFSLLTQVVGRCGRGELPGRAFIQTFTPDNRIIELAAIQDYRSFFEEEILSRRIHLYPPFCQLAGIGFVGRELDQVMHWSRRFLEKFTQVAGADYPGLPVRVLGPAPCDTLKIAGKYRYKLVVKCAANRATRQLLSGLQEWFGKESKTVSIFIDMYYDKM
ncbi:primosomal protein N' [Oscillospiraceae bacterium MB08-C2-2]|nr:primosomal protein N' [Oscillospiraceae bacterium MB08-C2-2]